MEHAFGAQLEDVRVHTGEDAHRFASKEKARAVTLGNHVAFGRGQYRPNTLAGDAILAHELAHVRQQRGASLDGPVTKSSDAGLEGDADRSAEAALAHLLGSRAESAAPKASTGFGLQLQRCSDPHPATQTGLTAAKKAFDQKHTNRLVSDDLTADELKRIHRAVEAVAGDNAELAVAFYNYYISHGIYKWDGEDLKEARKGHTYAETEPYSETYVDPKILEPNFSASTLGTIFLHELVHTRHKMNVMGLGEYQEGEAYGIELYLVQRANDKARQTEIIKIYSQYVHGNTPAVLAWRKHFFDAYSVMVVLHDRVDGKTVPGAPDNINKLTSGRAKELVAEYLTKSEDDRGAELKAIVDWARQNRDNLDGPLDRAVGQPESSPSPSK